MNPTTVTGTTPEVCQQSNDSVTFCLHCKVNPAKRRFCSNACRQAAYRLGPAHRENLDKQKVRRSDRRTRWMKARRRDMHMTFDALTSGYINGAVPRLGDFEKKPRRRVFRPSIRINLMKGV